MVNGRLVRSSMCLEYVTFELPSLNLAKSQKSQNKTPLAMM